MNTNWRRVFEFTFVMLIVALAVAWMINRWDSAKDEAAEDFGEIFNSPRLAPDKPKPEK